MDTNTHRKPRRFSVQWFAQKAVRFATALGIVCLLLTPEALIGPVS